MWKSLITKIILSVTIIGWIWAVFYMYYNKNTTNNTTTVNKTGSNKTDNNFDTNTKDQNNTNTISQIDLHKPITISFFMWDFSNINSKNLEEIKKSVKPLKWEMSFQIEEISTTMNIGKRKPIKWKKFYYVIYKVKWSSKNPKWKSIHPNIIFERWWTPAPQIVAYVDGQYKYSNILYSNRFMKEKNLDLARYVDIYHTDNWKSIAQVWELPKNQNIKFYIKYLSDKKEEKYILINK